MELKSFFTGKKHQQSDKTSYRMNEYKINTKKISQEISTENKQFSKEAQINTKYVTYIKLICKLKRHEITIMILNKNNKAESIITIDYMAYYRTIVTKTHGY